jgi:outer membrane protein assembly factor BamD
MVHAMHDPPAWKIIAACALIAIAACAPAADAQSRTYQLGDDRQWQVERSPEPGSDAWIIAEARRAILAGRAAQARRTLTDWLERNPQGPAELRAEALLARGDALVQLNREYQALFDYERLLREHPDSPRFATAIERELEIAERYANGLKRRVWGLRLFDGSEVAVEIFIRAQERAPGSAVAERAAIQLADFYYRERQLDLASEAYELYLQNFPSGVNARKAARRRIYSDLGRFKGPEYDTSALLDARVRVQQFEADFPAEAEATGINEGLVSRIDESLAAQMLESAEWYLQTGERASARLVLRRLVQQYPRTISGQAARGMLEERGWSLARTPGAVEPTEGADAAGERIDITGPVDAQPVETEPAEDEPAEDESADAGPPAPDAEAPR